MSAPCQFCKPHEAQGAERERRRIRRAQALALSRLRRYDVARLWSNVLSAALAIDAATRAPKGRGK